MRPAHSISFGQRNGSMSSRHYARACSAFAFALLIGATLSGAQAQVDHSKHSADEHAQHMAREKAQQPKPKKKPTKYTGHEGHSQHQGTPGGAHGAHGAQQNHSGRNAHGMKAFLGPYPMTREGSGTSWVPDATPHEGIHAQFGDWS